MFTGLVQDIGTIHLRGEKVLIQAPSSFSPLTLGESIAVDGVCLTVAEITEGGFFADISEETLRRTVLGGKATKKGFVNLEKAMRLSDRLGGHLVSGHIDGLGKIISIEKLPKSWNLHICWENDLFMKYICEKGSIAINGISLTVASIKQKGLIFSIAIIPHTWENTSLKYLMEGELINLETDLIAKYVERLLLRDSNELKRNNSKISINWLKTQGFT